jgi:histidyl-tRNA synthetase
MQAEFMHKLKPKLARQFEVLDKEQIPYALIIGPDEIKDGLVNIKTQVCFRVCFAVLNDLHQLVL